VLGHPVREGRRESEKLGPHRISEPGRNRKELREATVITDDPILRRMRRGVASASDRHILVGIANRFEPPGLNRSARCPLRTNFRRNRRRGYCLESIPKLANMMPSVGMRPSRCSAPHVHREGDWGWQSLDGAMTKAPCSRPSITSRRSCIACCRWHTYTRDSGRCGGDNVPGNNLPIPGSKTSSCSWVTISTATT